jgi:peptidyl-tRNA hydrolase, PTH1 family
MVLIAGLGNPGASHASNRHNIGFMAADEIARLHGFGPWRTKFRSDICEGSLAGEKVLLIKPQTYMNRSGEAIGEAIRFYKLSPSDVIVFYDELDLASGKVRVKTGGGSGGHNGIRSIDAHCGKNYRRVRLGIGHPGDKTLVQRHVLGNFAKSDRAWLDPFLHALAENVPLLVTGDDSTFMNRVTTALAADKKEAPRRRDSAGDPDSENAHHGQPKTAKGPMAAMLKRWFGTGGE